MRIEKSSGHRPQIAGRKINQDLDTATATIALLNTSVVATNQGWREAGTLVPADQLLTLKSGLQRVQSVEITPQADTTDQDNPSDWPVFIPEGALGNTADVAILPWQSVLVESALAEDLIGSRFVSVLAFYFDLLPGVMRLAPSAEAQVVTLVLSKPDALYGAGGLLLECSGVGAAGSPYPVLTASEARMILGHDVLPMAPAKGGRRNGPPTGS